MSNNSQQGTWNFGLLWIIVNTCGWGMYVIIAAAAGWIVWQAYQELSYGQGIQFLANESNRILIAIVIFSLCWGAIVGLVQQFVLRRRFKLEGKRWVLATIIGLLVYVAVRDSATLLAVIVMIPTLYSYVPYICKFTAPFALGVAQWFILRRYFARSGWWIAATVVSLWLSSFIPSATEYGRNISLYIASFPIEGLIYGIATLFALTIITKQSIVAVEIE